MNNSKHLYYSIILLSITPILGVYASIKSLTKKHLKIVLILFVTIYGATLRLSGTSDGVRFQQWVYDYYTNKSFATFTYELYRILIFNPVYGTKGDVYIHLISYLCGSVLYMPGIFFTLVGFVFGYFHITGLFRVFEMLPRHALSFPVKLAAIVFVGFLTIDMMQSIRTWTGAWILFNGVFGFHKTGEKKYLGLVFAAPFVHAAFFVMIIPAVIVLFLKRVNPVLLTAIFVSSFFVTLVPKNLLQSAESNAFAASKLDAYQMYDEEGNQILQGKEYSGTERRFYAKYGKGPAPIAGTKALLFSFILAGFFRRKKLTKLEFALLSTAILSASFANMSSFIPQLEGRLYLVTGVFTTAVTLLFLGRRQAYLRVNTKKMQSGWRSYLFIFSLLIFTPKIIYTIANLIQYTSIFMVVFPVFAFAFGDNNLSIREFLGIVMMGE